MRVLMVSKALVTGVYQKKLEELAKHRDLELLVVVPPFWKEGRVGKIELERRFTEGYEMVVEPMRFNGNHHLHWYPGLGRHMERFRPELVHIDEEPFNRVTMHTTELAQRVNAKTLFFTWQNIFKNYPPPFNRYERMAFRTASAAIAGNQEALEILRRKGYPGRAEVIPQFGVDPAIYRPLHPGVTRVPEPVIAYYGRLVPEKGIDTLIEALARIAPPVRAIVVGSGTERETLEQLAASLGVSDRVEFSGPIPAEQIPAFLDGVAVVVVPSRTTENWKEQFGRVIVEAMACGVPVIGSDSGEIPHVIGDAGIIFPEGDACALAGAIQQILDDPALAARLSEQGRERVLQRYTQQQVADATWRLYQEIMG